LVAVAVSTDEPPVEIDAGFAVNVTDAAPATVTVTVATAVALPPAPVAVAVYFVVADGLTLCVPPVEDRV